MYVVASCGAGCCGGRPAVGGGLGVGLGSLENLHQFPSDSAEVPSSVVDEGSGILSALLQLLDQFGLCFV